MMQKMNRNEFYEFVRDQIRNHLPEGFSEITISDVTSSRTNYKGLTAKKPGQSVSVSPVVNLDMFFEQYSNGINIDQILDDMVQIATKTNCDCVGSISSYIFDWEKVKERLFVTATNLMKVSTTVYEQVAGDLVLIIRVMINNDEGLSSAVVTKQLLDKWNVESEDAFHCAKVNTSRILGVKYIDLEKQSETITGEQTGAKMLVVTNDHVCLGGAVVFLPGIASIVAQKIGGDFYIVPSSIDETLCCQAAPEVDTEVLKATIKHVNNEVINPLNILSYKLYKYDSSSNRFEEV